MTSEEKYRMFLVENIRVASQMLYDMAYDIAGQSDHISDLSVTITFDQEMKSLPELTITRSHLPNACPHCKASLTKIVDETEHDKDVMP